MRTHDPKKMQAQCNAFNTKNKVGEFVTYWTGVREGEGKVGRIRFQAEVMGGHTPVVYIDGVGSVALSHVEAKS
jgi:hypothetical protein